MVKIPKSLMTSVINNLIDNAIYWLDHKWGTQTQKKYLYIGVSEEFDKGLAIVIADNGPGWGNISPEEVVKPFLTTKPGGMGIGLYFADTVAEMVGGELVILSPEDVEIPQKADGAVVAMVFNGGVPCGK
jgi:Signal transduction histidine kinase